MFNNNKNERVYKVWYYCHINRWCENGNSSVIPKETVVFQGTRDDCIRWIKIQFIDMSIKLVDLENVKVEIGMDTSDSDYEATVGLHWYNGAESVHYHSTYMLTDRF